MTTQFVQQRLRLNLLLFRKWWVSPRPLSLILGCGTIGFLGGHRIPRFITSLLPARLFRDGFLMLANATSGVPIC